MTTFFQIIIQTITAVIQSNTHKPELHSFTWPAAIVSQVHITIEHTLTASADVQRDATQSLPDARRTISQELQLCRTCYHEFINRHSI